VAIPSVTSTRWVGWNFSHICRRLWTKVHWIKQTCARVIAVCNTVFRLTMSCCVAEIFAMTSRSFPQSRRNVDVLGLQTFLEEDPPNFWANFINICHRRMRGKVRWRSTERPRQICGCDNGIVQYLVYLHLMWLIYVIYCIAAFSLSLSVFLPYYFYVFLLFYGSSAWNKDWLIDWLIG